MTTHYAAIDSSNITGAVYGVGETVAEALAVARDGGADGELKVVPCSARASALVEKRGGAPHRDLHVEPEGVTCCSESDTEPTVTTDWTIAPEDQGQIVEYAYAADWESGALYRRVRDTSDGSVRYYRASSAQLRGEWEPQNSVPMVAGEWHAVR